jgi:hypothetical protein
MLKKRADVTVSGGQSSARNRSGSIWFEARIVLGDTSGGKHYLSLGK